MNLTLRMHFRAKALLCAITCLAAVLTAATLAQAVDQTPKNGCTSPLAYEGSLTSPPFNPLAEVGSPPSIEFQGWFEIESVAPGAFDTMTVEYSLEPPAGGARDWIQFGELTDPAQVQPNSGGAPDMPYSNNGTGVTPGFQTYTFPLPAAAHTTKRSGPHPLRDGRPDLPGLPRRRCGLDQHPHVRSRGLTGLREWRRDVDARPANSPGAPFWQVLSNPQNVSVKNPEVNPALVTLPDSGALPAAFSAPNVAWFGNAASGTFCGPDFANTDQPPDTTITSGPEGTVPSTDATFEFTASEQAFFECQLDAGGFIPCGSPQNYSSLALGAHTFEVRATDFTGNTDPTPATRTWTVREKTLNDLDNPTQGVDVNVDQVSGTVLVGLTGAAARCGAQ